VDDDALKSAEQTVANERAPWTKIRWAAFHLFEAGRFDLAQLGFERLVAIGRADNQVVTTLHQIYTDQGEFAVASHLIARYIEERGSDLSPHEHLDLAALLVDTLAADPAHPDRSTAVLQLLEAAASAGPDGWKAVLDPDRREVIESTSQDPEIALPALEQFLYAPAETGLTTVALNRIEAFGCFHANDWERSRSAERLLHAAGHPEAAYRVETCRREAKRPTLSPPPPALPPATLRIGSVAIAGGHPALRSLTRRDLATLGIADVREIPSAWEATRDGRSVQATVAGVDLIVVITRQIAHTTSDQVRTAATRLNIPVVYAESPAVAAIRRAVEQVAITDRA
jgi:hypothetical protein